MLVLGSIGGPDILWSVKKTCNGQSQHGQCLCQMCRCAARAFSSTKMNIDNMVIVCNTAQCCRLGSFQDADFTGDLGDSKSTSVRVLCLSGKRTFVPISWVCQKHTSVFHRLTESNIISLDAGLRLDGILALDLWDLMTKVLFSSNNV